MNLGDVIRVLEVPATVPAETAPQRGPGPAPSGAPSEQPAVPAKSRVPTAGTTHATEPQP